MDTASPKLFRDKEGNVKSMLSHVEGISFRESPLDFFILLARYKFAARLVNKSHSILDAGCGHGQGTVFLSKFAAHVTGVDADPELIAQNRTHHVDVPHVSFESLDLLDISNHKNRYDVVVSMDVIEHFTREQTEIVAKNYAALTNQFAVIGTPNIASQPFASKRRRETHLHEFEPAEFQQLLSKFYRQVFLFSMTDEVVSLTFPKMAWYLMALCVK